MDELEKRAMEIIEKRPDKEAFLKFLERKASDKQEIFQILVESPQISISVIKTLLLPEY